MRLWLQLRLMLAVAAMARAAGAATEGGAEEEQPTPTQSLCPCDVVAAAAFNCSSRGLEFFPLCGGGAQGGVREMDASNNALSDAAWEKSDAAAPAWMQTVETLDASHNTLETFHAEHMKKLRTLFVNDNSLQTLLLPAAGCELERLNASGNALIRLPEGWTKACPSLSEVDASSNEIRELPVDIVLILDTERMSAGNVSVDLRENPLSEANVSAAVLTAMETLDCGLRVIPDVDDCACASLQRDKGFSFLLRLCVSSMCFEGNERWSDIATRCLRHTTEAPAERETSTTLFKLEGEKFKDDDIVAMTSPEPPPLVPPPSPPPREDRRRRRLALALVLTAVALVLGAGLVGALVVLYRRRRREVRLEAAAARLALKPLVSDTTPRFMRATDDFSS